MTRSPLAFALLALCALATTASRAVSDEPPASPGDMMKLMEKYAKPGPHHAELGALVGTWDVEVRVMGGQPAKGTAETKWWLKDRFVETRINVPKRLMGRDIEFVTLSGWDNYKKKWVGTHASSMGTNLIHHEGVVVDPTGKVMVTYGTLDEYLTGEHDKAVKYVTRMLGPDSHVVEVWDLAIGENGGIVFSFTLTRRK